MFVPIKEHIRNYEFHKDIIACNIHLTRLCGRYIQKWKLQAMVFQFQKESMEPPPKEPDSKDLEYCHYGEVTQ